MKKLFVLIFITLICSAIQAQSLDDYARSINSQSPSRWINDFYRLKGASYKTHTFKLNYEFKQGIYFDAESLNKNPINSKKLMSYIVSSLYYNKNYKALFNTIIKENASLEITLSMLNSKAKSTGSYSSFLLKNILSNDLMSREEIFLHGHVIATNIVNPSVIDDGMWLEKCMMEKNRLVYHVTCDFLTNDKMEQEIVKPVMKRLFWDSVLKHPAGEQLVRSCLKTKTDICWLVKDKKTKREFFTITFGEKDLKKSLGIK